jgi:protein TonB
METRRKSILSSRILFWGIPLLTAFLLNGILISFIPGLVSPISDRSPEIESLPGFRMVRLKPPVPAIENKVFPKNVAPPLKSKVKPEAIKIAINMPKELKLPLNLKTQLPAIGLTTKTLPVMNFTLPPPKSSTLKSFYTPDEIDQPLMPLVRHPPVYPRSAKRQGIQGWVDIVYTINRSGDVKNIQVVNATPKGIYEKSVLRAVSSWRFSPGTVGGKPVNIRVKQRLRFELNHDRN